MESEFFQEWHRLEDEARRKLEAWPSTGGWVECHAVILPSFEDCKSYTLIVPRPGQGSPTGVRRVWRRNHDLAKFESPVIRLRYSPQLIATLDQHEATLEPGAVEAILARAATLKVPARVPVGSLGLDGTTYLIMFGRFSLTSRFQWWAEPPPGWEELGDLLQETVGLIESVVS